MDTRQPAADYDEAVQLTKSVFMYKSRKMSDHGNVFEGEIRSGVYDVRACAVKIACKSEQLIREAKILTKLGSHTHVISIIQSGIYEDAFEDHVFIALDKCHEHNLDQHITHRKESGVDFNVSEALKYSKQIIAGVTYVHENLIIHKDLKPSNILLSHDKTTIKLADFGLSREIKSRSSKVFSKHQFGTDGFRPIESFGDNWVSLKSDIFSLGVVVYFVLSNGKSPHGDNFSLLNYKMQNGVIDLSHLLVANANTLQHLIKLMLSAERCRRPSIWEVADHPCWTGKEIECNFDYGFTEEIDDCNGKIPKDGAQILTKSVSESESRRQFLKALNEMGFNATKNANERSIGTRSDAPSVLVEGCSRENSGAATPVMEEPEPEDEGITFSVKKDEPEPEPEPEPEEHPSTVASERELAWRSAYPNHQIQEKPGYQLPFTFAPPTSWQELHSAYNVPEGPGFIELGIILSNELFIQPKYMGATMHLLSWLRQVQWMSSHDALRMKIEYAKSNGYQIYVRFYPHPNPMPMWTSMVKPYHTWNETFH